MRRQFFRRESLLRRQARTQILNEDVGVLHQLVDLRSVLVVARVEVGLPQSRIALPVKGGVLDPVPGVEVQAIGPLGGELANDRWAGNHMNHAQRSYTRKRSFGRT